LIRESLLDEQDQLNALRLLAQKKFDAVGFSTDVKDMTFEVINVSLSFCDYRFWCF
jgi:hypothetical protein